MNTTVTLNIQLIKALSDVLLMSSTKIMKLTKIPNSTWYYITDHPEGISIQYLLAIANSLHIPVRRFFSTGKETLIGKRDDYIQEPYQDCSYDASALQHLVSNRTNVTWQMASDATGITRDNLRKSLLAERRTPVQRFLTVCNVFGIDPFTILIDPNPVVTKQKHGKQNAGQNISDLRRHIEALSSAIADLTQKYEDLLHSHEALVKRISYDIHHVNQNTISLVAESPTTKYNKKK